MAKDPKLHPTSKSRIGGKIRARLPNPSWWPFGRYGQSPNGCAICHSSRVVVKENNREFCRIHHPGRAAYLVLPVHERGYSGYNYYTSPPPDRHTCERILKLAGRIEPAKKPARSKKRKRDRRYVNR